MDVGSPGHPPGHNLAALAIASLAAFGSGCSGDEADNGTGSEPGLESMRLGRVHVVIEPEAERLIDEDIDDAEAFEISARFAFVQGFDEDFVRARVDMPLLPTEVVRPGDCIASDQLATAGPYEAEVTDLQELHLVDAGNLSVQIGEDDIDVPLSLVPDLLPYMHGVEYLYFDDELPPELPDDGGLVYVEAKGSQTEEFPPFRAEGEVPAALALDVTDNDLAELGKGALVLRWAGEGEGLITVRLTGLQGGQPVGADLTCVLNDVGQTRLSFDGLRPLGLMLDAEALRVTASRLQATQFDAGDFVGSELFVERREKIVLPLR